MRKGKPGVLGTHGCFCQLQITNDVRLQGKGREIKHKRANREGGSVPDFNAEFRTERFSAGFKNRAL